MKSLRALALVFVLGLLVSGLGFAFLGLGGAMVSLFLFLSFCLFCMWFGADMLIRLIGATPVEEMTDVAWLNVFQSDVNVLAERAGIPTPQLLILDTPHTNAFALGATPKSASIIVTTGLVKLLSRTEVAGVIAHELAHIRSGDTRISSAFAALFSVLSWPFGQLRFARKAKSATLPAASAFSPVVCGLTAWIMGEKSEFDADRVGASICGDPRYLMGALQKIERGSRAAICEGLASRPELRHLCTIDPKPELRAHAPSSHPQTAHRVAELRRLVKA